MAISLRVETAGRANPVLNTRRARLRHANSPLGNYGRYDRHKITWYREPHSCYCELLAIRWKA
jgi:hypothetical protein